VAGTVSNFWAPAAYTFMAMHWGTAGWLLIAGIIVLAGAGLHPAAHAAERFAALNFEHSPELNHDPAVTN
jgi:hypothetical protein